MMSPLGVDRNDRTSGKPAHASGTSIRDEALIRGGGIISGTMGKTVARFVDGDVANQLLRAFRVDSAVLCRSVMGAPWGFGVSKRDVGSFHMVIEGGGWLQVDELGSPIPLRTGDLAILPRGSAHWVKDSPTSAAPALTSILAQHDVVEGELHFGGDEGPLSEIVCGLFALEDSRPAWLDRLPPVIVSRIKPERNDWRRGVSQALRNEARAPTEGGASVVNRLLESLLADAFRDELTKSVGDVALSKEALSNRRIGTVLQRLNENLARGWSLEGLAGIAAMSRSAFSELFRSTVGEPPMRYLTTLRLAKAARLLRSTEGTVAEIARRVGYRSVESLSRAFKARFGDSPSEFRRRARSGVSVR